MFTSVSRLIQNDSVCIMPYKGFYRYRFPSRIMTDPKFMDDAEQLFDLFKAEQILIIMEGTNTPVYRTGFSRYAIRMFHEDIKRQNLFNFPFQTFGFILWYSNIELWSRVRNLNRNMTTKQSRKKTPSKIMNY